MIRYGIIFDSSCGLSKEKVENDNNFFVPLIIELSNKKYKAGVDIDSNIIFRSLLSNRKNVTIKTSTPEFGDFQKAFDAGLKKHEELIYIGLSKNFSSTINVARNVIENDVKYKNRIHIYDSLFAAPWTQYYYKFINELIKNSNLKTKEIFKILKNIEKYQIAYISPGDIYWLYKGGRITKTQYITGSLINISTILVLRDGQISKKDAIKVRTKKKAINKMIEMFLKKNEEFQLSSEEMEIGILDGGNSELTNFTKNIIKEQINNNFNIVNLTISPEQAAHIGPDSLGICFLWKPKKSYL